MERDGNPTPVVAVDPEGIAVEAVDGAPARSFDDVYRAEHDRLVRVAALLLGSSAVAEDVVQESFAKLHERFERVDLPAAWLTTVVVRACRNERRRWATARRQAHRLRSPEVVPDQPVHELVESLRRLPARQRAVVVLRYYADLPEAEIATLLGMRPGTVKSTLHRALARLRQEVEP